MYRASGCQIGIQVCANVSNSAVPASSPTGCNFSLIDNARFVNCSFRTYCSSLPPRVGMNIFTCETWSRIFCLFVTLCLTVGTARPKEAKEERVAQKAGKAKSARTLIIFSPPSFRCRQLCKQHYMGTATLAGKLLARLKKPLHFGIKNKNKTHYVGGGNPPTWPQGSPGKACSCTRNQGTCKSTCHDADASSNLTCAALRQSS